MDEINTAPRTLRGFTLIELAMVLVIVGLVIGGILVGREMIRSATISQVARNYNLYATAYITFKDKYNCIPGDCGNATKFGLGSNGDSDGKIWPYETRNLCFHLTNAAMVPAGCTIEGFTPSLGVKANVNALPNPYTGSALFEISYITPNAPYTLHYPPGNYISVGGESPAGNYYPYGVFNSQAMFPEDAYRLDTKIDDGKPLSGQLLQYGNYVCVDMATNTYSLAYSNNLFCSSDYRLP